MPKRRVERTDEIIERKDKKNRKFPQPLMHVDKSGIIKVKTLEFFVFDYTHDWKSAKEFSKDPVFEAYLYCSGWRCLSIRLQRYWRQGLIDRKRFGRCYKYKLAFKGEQRLCHQWKKLGLLSPPTDVTSTDGERNVNTKLAEIRLAFYKRINTKSKQQFEEQKLENEKARKHLWEIFPIKISSSESDRLFHEIFLKKNDNALNN